MPRLAGPLSDFKCRPAKPRERAYKLFDGGGMYLFVKPNGVKTWRLRYFKPSGKEGTLIIGNYPIISLAVARTKRDEAKALLIDNLDPMEERRSEASCSTSFPAFRNRRPGVARRNVPALDRGARQDRHESTAYPRLPADRPTPHR